MNYMAAVLFKDAYVPMCIAVSNIVFLIIPVGVAKVRHSLILHIAALLLLLIITWHILEVRLMLYNDAELIHSLEESCAINNYINQF